MRVRSRRILRFAGFEGATPSPNAPIPVFNNLALERLYERQRVEKGAGTLQEPSPSWYDISR